MMVGGVGGDSGGEVVVEKGKLVWRGWQPAGSTGQYNSRWRQTEKRGKVGKSGEFELDNVVLGGVPADDGGEAVGVLDRVEVVLVADGSREESH